MKFIFGFLLMSSAAWSGELSSSLRYKTVQPCDWWNSVNASGVRGYVCQTNPMRVPLVDFYSLERVLHEYESRIVALETKISEMEKTLNDKN